MRRAIMGLRALQKFVQRSVEKGVMTDWLYSVQRYERTHETNVSDVTKRLQNMKA